MKKATAFLTLLGLLAILGGSVYVIKFHPEPQQFEPMIKACSDLIADQYRSPALLGIILLWLAAFVTSVSGLLGKTAEPAPEKVAAPQQEEKPSVEEEKPEMVLKSEFDARGLELEQARGKIASLEPELEALKEQLEKTVQTEEEAQAKAELQNRIAELERKLTDLQVKNTEIQQVAGNAEEVKRRFEIEVEALTAKIGKTEEEIRIAKKEGEKAFAELKNSKSEAEKIKQQLETLKEENEKTKAELQAAMADAKSGKHGIPPAAFQILYLFQKEGRLIDLLMEDVTDFDDETLGGAIRPIHEGCRKLLKERLIIEPVLSEDEGSVITLEEVDPEAIKLSGNVPSKGPYKGELVHRGWRLKECHLPELVGGWTGNVVAPAEIEIG